MDQKQHFKSKQENSKVGPVCRILAGIYNNFEKGHIVDVR
jgi:hypothetical protein